jgi:hypothetical protein
LKTSTFKAICHTFFIAKDVGQQINWRKPLIQKSEITTTVSVANHPFAEGAMRYAFLMKDTTLKQDMVAKVPKDMNPTTYNLETMKSDIEAHFICQHIVNEFNERILGKQDEKLLTDFVHSFIYEFTDSKVTLNLAYGENLIMGKYQKYNNNAGWKTGKDTKQGYIA